MLILPLYQEAKEMKTTLPAGLYCEYRNGTENWYRAEGGYIYPVAFERIKGELPAMRYVLLVVSNYIKYHFCRFEAAKM